MCVAIFRAKSARVFRVLCSLSFAENRHQISCTSWFIGGERAGCSSIMAVRAHRIKQFMLPLYFRKFPSEGTAAQLLKTRGYYVFRPITGKVQKKVGTNPGEHLFPMLLILPGCRGRPHKTLYVTTVGRNSKKWRVPDVPHEKCRKPASPICGDW